MAKRHTDIIEALRHLADSIEQALQDEHMNEDTALELTLLTIGTTVEERGLGRHLVRGVEMQKRRQVEHVKATLQGGSE